ncbi:MAG: 3-deoxy-7-phosphoheptulonate synthase [Pirellulales bacterium]|nr:3-deoxy-7-phosphoheptulonate synthase [Pirellulales bacterium]
MIIVMKHTATEADIQSMVKEVETKGLKANVIRGTERTVIAAVGEERVAGIGSLESGTGVDEVIPIVAPYKLASRELKSESSTVKAGSLTVGNGNIGVIGGPCSVENEEQIVSAAHAVKKAGATALRGGAFKPRTSPYSYQGKKEDGRKLLAEARNQTGLAIVTEVVSPDDVDLVSKYSEVLQIGARNMQNYRLLEAVGRSPRAVLLKRGPSATIDEWLLAAEYILDGGNSNVMLCERGIRTFEAHTRFTLPLASVAYVQQRTHLPVVIDPSHGTGHTYLVPSMSRAAIAAGADGLIIEVHPNPEQAMSDGYQSLNFEQFADLMAGCKKIADAVEQQLGSL